MTAIAAWLAERWLVKRAAALWAVLSRYPRECLCVALLLALAWCWHGWSKSDARNKVIIAAQSQATQAQIAVNHAPAVLSQAIARKSNHDAQEYYAKGRAAGLAYADSHRVRAGSCRASGADLRGAYHAAPVDERPSDDAVVVTRADFEILTGNSTRLAQVHADAQALIAAGLATEGQTQ